MNLRGYNSAELLALHSRISTELRNRNVTRSANNPTGDLAELMFCRAFEWEQENNSKKGYDAYLDRTRYQIKGRRLDNGRGSRQLSFIRAIETRPFDFLAAVIFNLDYTIWRAAIIPFELVLKQSKPVKHVNGHRFLLRDSIWNENDVVDVTSTLRAIKL